jgi:hypothetical protein
MLAAALSAGPGGGESNRRNVSELSDDKAALLVSKLPAQAPATRAQRKAYREFMDGGGTKDEIPH